MGVVIAVANQKGGVGKTTTANALTLGLKRRSFSVLAIDLDPQGNFSFSLGADPGYPLTAYHVLTQKNPAEGAVQKTALADVIAGNVTLSNVQIEHTNKGWEFILRKALEKLRSAYDYIVIDTPPSLSILTINAFAASDHILVPISADIFSLQGLAMLNETVVRVHDFCNPDLKVLGIVLTRYSDRTLLGREIRDTAQMVAKQFGFPLLNTHIRASVAITEAQSLQADMFEYMPKNTAVQDYDKLLNELLKKRGL